MNLADFERANEAWGANCGPGAFAEIRGMLIEGVRVHFGDNWPGYTNPTAMRRALDSARVRWREVGPQPHAGYQLRPWPRWGLCRIQWEGPWTGAGVPAKARYRYTHWVGAAQRGEDNSIGIFDVNALANGSGWCSVNDWSTHLAPALAKDHDKRATGRWHITHAIEVQRC